LESKPTWKHKLTFIILTNINLYTSMIKRNNAKPITSEMIDE